MHSPSGERLSYLFPPVLNLAAYLYLHLVWVVRNNEVDKMFGSGFKLESALVEITYTFHYHFDEWSSVFYALRHDDCRVDVVALLMSDDALLGSLHITGCHACLKVDGGCRYRAVDGYLGMGRHFSLKVFALDQAYLELAHDVLEVEADRGVGV